MLPKNSLPKMAMIKTSYIKSFNNVMHTDYHRTVYELIKKVEKGKLNISDAMLAAWNANIQLEIDLSKQTTASAITKQLAEKDRERKKVLTLLFALVRAQRLSLVADKRAAAEKLYVTLKPYQGINRETFAEKSVLIVGLLMDTDKFPTETAALELTEILTTLKTLNEEFEKLDSQRRKDEVDAKLPSARKVRQMTDEDFEVIRQCIQTSYILAKSQADKELILHLTEEMNRLNADLKASYKSSLSHKAAAAAKKAAIEAEKKAREEAAKKAEAEKKAAADVEKTSETEKKPSTDAEKSMKADTTSQNSPEKSLDVDNSSTDKSEKSFDPNKKSRDSVEKLL